MQMSHHITTYATANAITEHQQREYVPEWPQKEKIATAKLQLLESQKKVQKLNDDGEDNREEWNNQCDFFLSILGYAVDLANVWRFPYVCFTNGGGAFLIPYFIVMICSATPMFYLELILGQKHRHGAISLWDICPLFRGVGLAQVTISYIVAFYYNTISAWSLHFLLASITDILPWTYCDQRRGNSINCVNFSYLHNVSVNASSGNGLLQLQNYSLASTEYFERVVLKLQESNGLEDLGPMRWQLAGCTVSIFCILYASMRNGVKTSGKVVYVTAILPYFLLAILLFNGLTLDGSYEGIWYFIRPRFDKLSEMTVWANAAIQIFFSTGAGFGAHIAYATYNPRKYNCYRDCLITSLVNALTSMFAGVTVFAYLGYLAHLTHTSVQTVTGEAWFYGMDELCQDIKSMNLPTPNIYWRFCWKILTPITLIVMIVSSVIDPTPLQYNYGAKHPELLTNNTEVVNITLHGTSQFYSYPEWSIYLGWVMSGVSISMIPLVFFIVLIRDGIKLEVTKAFSVGPLDVWPFKQWNQACNSTANEQKRVCRKYTAEIESDKNIRGNHLVLSQSQNQIIPQELQMTQSRISV
ncbi:unnamed protein product [Heterobilharzia americana]|nr:unnamed protein product [Heterobilharzia americana]